MNNFIKGGSMKKKNKKTQHKPKKTAPRFYVVGNIVFKVLSNKAYPFYWAGRP
jgi:hypothetical protein